VTEGKIGEIQYADGSHMKGLIYNTTVWLGTATATSVAALFVTDYKDTTIEAGKLSDYDGICGLTPKVVSTGAQLLVSALASQFALPKDMFSIHYDLSNGSSYIYFGDYES
jgi:hypothetical protein